MELLKRNQAPLTPRAWEEIDEAIRGVLVARLCGRKVVDVNGPLGMEAAAVNLGRLDICEEAQDGGVRCGIRRVQPLVEARINFDLDVWELDNVERGARDIDLAAAEEAALAMARFEDTAIFNGFAPAGITGLARLEEHEPIPLTREPTELLGALAQGVVAMKDAAVEGPFHLVVGPDVFQALHAQQSAGYPLRRQAADIVGGQVHYSTVLDGALLVSARGGDFELTIGQDLAVGYDSREDGKVKLFVTGSFAFRVLDPAACLHLPAQKE